MTITPAAGQVVVNSVDPALTLSTRSDAVHLDSDGLMRAYLVCTDDPDIEPHNSWTYSFRGDWSGSPTVTCPVPMVPVDPETGKMPPLNLSTAVSRASVSGVLITKGAPGDRGPGIASIDPDGTVHLDDGSTVTWDLPPAVADDAAVAELVASETATKSAVESRIREVGDGTYAPLDAGSTSVTYNPNGSVASVTESGITTSYGYNTDGSIASDTRLDVLRLYVYDGAGNLVSIGAGEPAEETFTYSAGALTSHTRAGITTTYTYGIGGQVATETTGGVTKTYTYDGSGNLTGIASA